MFSKMFALAATATTAAAAAIGVGSPVQLGFYYESLCPFCERFCESQLTPHYDELLPVMNVTLIPWGNARDHSDPRNNDYYFTCQHGDDECTGNRIETAALNLYAGRPEQWFKFIACLEGSNPASSSAGQSCGSKTKVNYRNVRKLAMSDAGAKLAWEQGQITKALNPPHKYVPWLVFDGVFDENIQNAAQGNLVRTLCSLWKRKNSGVAPPAVCA